MGKHYKVHIPDLYKGKSLFLKEATSIENYVTELARFIDRMHFTDYYLIGISLSGIIVNKYVLGYPLKPKKLFLVSTTILPLKIKRQRQTLFWGYLKLLYHNMFSLKGISVNLMWIIDGMENAIMHFRQTILEGIIASSLKIKEIKSLPISTKLIFARKDEYIPSEAVNRLSKVKNLELEVVNGYHGWFFGREEELVQKIYKFLR